MGFNTGGGGGSGSSISPSDKYLVGDALTDGSIRMIGTNDSFQVQKRVSGAWVTMIDSDVPQTTINDSVKTGVGSLHLGDVHSIGSAAENVIFKNENTGVSWFPVWQGVTTDGVTVTAPASRIYQAKIASQPVGATAASSGQIDYSFQTTFAANTSVFAVKIVAAEAYTGKAYWSASYTSGKEISYFSFDVTCVAGTIIDIPFKYPLDARNGAVVNVRITKVDGSFLKVRASSTQPAQPWRELTVRLFSDSGLPIDYNAANEYGIGTKSLWHGQQVIANAVIPAGTAFAWGTTGATWKPDLSGSMLNWRGVWASATNYAVNDLIAPTSTDMRVFACSTAITSSVSNPTTLTGADVGSWQQHMFGGAPIQYVPPKVTRFTGNGTWTPAPGMKYAIAEVQGGGASSGTSNVTVGTSVNCWACGAGGAGSYAKVMITAAQAGTSQTVTVGVDAQPFTTATTQAGRTGNTSSIGTLVSCVGGVSGTATGEVSAVARIAPGGRAAAPTVSGCTLLYSLQGQSSEGSCAISASVATYGTLQAGSGGSSPLGNGGKGQLTCNAIDTVTTGFQTPDGYGSGASGKAGYGNTGVQYVGFAGQQGIVIITEYFQ